MFFPPELSETYSESDSLSGGLQGSQMEALRRLFFEREHQQKRDPEADRHLVSLVVDYARAIISHPSRRRETQLESVLHYPTEEIDLENSIEENPLLSDPRDLLVEFQKDKPFTCIGILDASSSMSGDKHLLASIAVAVLLLHVPSRDNSIILFSSDAKRVKELGIEEAPEETVLRFLKARPHGFTNIARGLEEGLKQYRKWGGSHKKVGLIATDGRTTEGKDPLSFAKKYDFLAVLHLHGPGSHLESSKELAQAGHGICLEVERFDQMPRRMYDALKRL